MQKEDIIRPVFTGVFIFCVFLASIGIVIGSMAGYVLALFPLVFLLFVSNKSALIYMYLIIAPFSNAPVIATNIMGIPGAKVFNLISAGLIGALFLNRGNQNHEKSKLDNKVVIYLLIYFFIFTIAIFRSLGYLSTLHLLRPEMFESSSFHYLLSFYIRPSLYIAPFLYILKYIKTEDDINKITNAICISLSLLSISIILISIFHFSEIVKGRGYVREVFAMYLGLHYNSLGTIYLSCFPVLLYRAVNNRSLNIVNLILASISIVFLQSRTTIVIVLIGTIVMLFVLNRKKLLVLVLVFLGCFSPFFIPSFLVRTATTGFQDKTLESFLSGRFNYLWKPLIMEWINDPQLLLFGKGRYGLIASASYMRGYNEQLTHAHNAFIDFFLDCGVILLSVIVYFGIKHMKLAWNIGRRINKDLYWAFFASFIFYLIATMTSRQIFPSVDNMFLFPIVALAINLYRLHYFTHSKEQVP